MQVFWLLIGLIVGAAVGLLVFYLMVYAAAWAFNCLKNCHFPVWPFVVVVLGPLILVLMRDLRGWFKTEDMQKRRISLEWLTIRSIPIGMAVSTLHLTPFGAGLITSIGSSIWT